MIRKMDKEFNLSEERNKLYNLFKSEEYKAVVRDVLREVEKQDKEFIKRLKKKADLDKIDCEIVDKLAGDKLI